MYSHRTKFDDFKFLFPLGKGHRLARNNSAGYSMDQDKESQSHQNISSKVKRQAPPKPPLPICQSQRPMQGNSSGEAGHRDVVLKQGSSVHQLQPSVKGLSPPSKLDLKLVKPDCVLVTWKHSKGITDEPKFRVIWTSKSDGKEESLEVQVQKITIKDLMAEETYEFKVDYLHEDKKYSSVSLTITTGVPLPEEVKVDSVTDTSANLSWSLSNKMRQRPHKFLISYWSEESEASDVEAIYTESYTTDITGLTPGTEYTVCIHTVLQHGKQSEAAGTYFTTKATGKGEIKPSLLDSKQTTLSRGWKFYTVAPEKALPIVQEISTRLKGCHMTETYSVKECEFILAVCPVVSRLGTDVAAVLKMIPANRPAILVVVHHTFKQDYVVPDSKRFVRRSGMLLVDLLFEEDQGFLPCTRNETAFANIKEWTQSNIKGSPC